MRIVCPYCGPSDSDEFTALGTFDADRPDPGADPAAWHAYQHLRTNPAGEATERWHHLHGCRRWLVVRRDTRTHAIHGVTAIGEAS